MALTLTSEDSLILRSVNTVASLTLRLTDSYCKLQKLGMWFASWVYMLDVCRHCCVLLFIPAMILSGVCCCAVCADCFLHSSSMLDRCWWWLFLQLDGPLPPVSHVWYTYMYHSTNLVSFPTTKCSQIGDFFLNLASAMKPDSTARRQVGIMGLILWPLHTVNAKILVGKKFWRFCLKTVILKYWQILNLAVWSWPIFACVRTQK